MKGPNFKSSLSAFDLIWNITETLATTVAFSFFWMGEDGKMEKRSISLSLCDVIRIMWIFVSEQFFATLLIPKCIEFSLFRSNDRSKYYISLAIFLFIFIFKTVF